MSSLEKKLAERALSAWNVPSDAYDGPTVKGYDFSDPAGVDYSKLLDSYATTGFQATNFGDAVSVINSMIETREEPYTGERLAGNIRPARGCTIFLGFTSNMISSGVRETIKFLVKNDLVDVIVTTCGGIEEDIMKCFAPHQIGDFELRGTVLREKGLNRIGNLIVPSSSYMTMDKFMDPVLDEMHARQKKNGEIWCPTKITSLLGERIANPDSFLYWAWKNKIPVFCPAITDGAIGDNIYFNNSTKHNEDPLIVDIAQDVILIDRMAGAAQKTGMIILGGGVVKHHICNANLTRNGADFSVYINTGQPFDGSDAGATPDEAVSWGKIRSDARKPVKVYAEATLVFPLLVAKTFAEKFFKSKEKEDSSECNGKL